MNNNSPETDIGVEPKDQKSNAAEPRELLPLRNPHTVVVSSHLIFLSSARVKSVCVTL